jgi:hypothetical protein
LKGIVTVAMKANRMASSLAPDLEMRLNELQAVVKVHLLVMVWAIL